MSSDRSSQSRCASLGEAVSCGTCTCLASTVFGAAELGRQALLIHVEIPKRGKIHVCSAIHNTTTPRPMKIPMCPPPRSFDILLGSFAQYSEYAKRKIRFTTVPFQGNLPVTWAYSSSTALTRHGLPGRPAAPRADRTLVLGQVAGHFERHASQKKADMAKHPKVLSHVGLLVNEPPGQAELLFI